MTVRTSDWSLQPLASPKPSSMLLYRGNPEVSAPGVLLEAQFSVPDGWLLFTTDDVPFEEVLHIVLLDLNKRLIGTRSLGKPYSSAVAGSFEIDGDSILFDFPAKTRWRASVRPARLIGGRIKVDRCGG